MTSQDPQEKLHQCHRCGDETFDYLVDLGLLLPHNALCRSCREKIRAHHIEPFDMLQKLLDRVFKDKNGLSD